MRKSGEVELPSVDWVIARVDYHQQLKDRSQAYKEVQTPIVTCFSIRKLSSSLYGTG